MQIDFRFFDSEVIKIQVVIISVFTFLFGQYDDLMGYLLLLNFIDILTGMIKANKYSSISSRVFRKGLQGKGGIWILVIISNIMDIAFFSEVPIARSALLISVIALEMLSILENLQSVNPQLVRYIPKVMSEKLVQVIEENDEINSVDNLKDAEIINVDNIKIKSEIDSEGD